MKDSVELPVIKDTPKPKKSLVDIMLENPLVTSGTTVNHRFYTTYSVGLDILVKTSDISPLKAYNIEHGGTR